MIQNIWDATKAVLRGKISSGNKKISNNLILHLKKLKKDDQTKSKVSRWKEIMKIRAEINEIEVKKKKHRKDQWNYKPILWKDKENW